MNLKNRLIIVILLSSLPLALALTTLDTNKDIYSEKEAVNINGTCNYSSVSVALQIMLGDDTVWVDQISTDNSQKFAQTYSLSSTHGTYVIYAACQNDTAVTTSFCLGSQEECQPKVVEEKKEKKTSSGGGGGGKTCVGEWTCGEWGYCDATLKQTRICSDQMACEANRVETRLCNKCLESWTCSAWSDCQSGEQYRDCTDEHACGTSATKPILQKACEVEETGPAPSQTYYQPPSVAPPPTYVSGIQKPAPTFWDKFWDKYRWYITGIPLVLILLVLVIFLVWHFRQGAAPAGEESIEDWVAKERNAGASDEEIKEKMKKEGWTEEEIEKVV